jgi:hypothetical protein
METENKQNGQEVAYYKHPITLEVKTLRGGNFNRDLFWLGIIYLLKEGDYKNGLLLSFMTSIPLLFAFNLTPEFSFVAVLYSLIVLLAMAKEYNRVRAKELLAQGFEKVK